MLLLTRYNPFFSVYLFQFSKVHMKTLLTLSIFLLTGLSLHAQHCSWDGCSIIVVDIRDAETGEVINGLEVLLCDSMGNPYRNEWNLRNHQDVHLYQHTDTLKFGQNRKASTQKFSQHQGPFPFGLDCYMLLVYYNNYPEFNKHGKDQIVIRDPLGRYKTKMVSFTEKNIDHMCTNNPIWEDEKALDKTKIVVGMGE